MKIEDFTGRKIGMLTGLRRVGKTKSNQSIWRWRCDCGNEKELVSSEVKRGKSSSCGCLLKSVITTHGLSSSKIYTAWCNMKKRCYNSSCQAWKHYGGRGIIVCDEWLHSFNNFYKDMHPTYSEELTLERIDVNGNYCPSNCTWATTKVQARNKRNSRIIETIFGKTTVAEAAELSGINSMLLYARLHRGVSESRILAVRKIETSVGFISTREASMIAGVDPSTINYRVRHGWPKNKILMPATNNKKNIPELELNL